MITLKATRTSEEDTYTSTVYDIVSDEEKVGAATIMESEEGTYLERLDMLDGQKGKGYGTETIKKLAGMYDTLYATPDNEGSARLFARLGSTYEGEDAEYLDMGFGVYEF